MARSDGLESLIPQLRETLLGFRQISFAVIFGSAVRGRLRDDSDLDVAVYLNEERALEVEAEREVPEEADLQIATPNTPSPGPG